MARRLTIQEENRIRMAIRHCLMHFAPTISPAPKMTEKGEIESIESALHYYASKGISTVILQPKHMGSYCDIYLHKDIEQTRFFSRKGYLVSRLIEHAALIKKVEELHARFDWNGVKMRLIQSELMPWSALGGGLIERDFGGYETCHDDHCTYLEDTGLRDACAALMDTEEYLEYKEDAANLNKKELRKKYSDHIIKQYDALDKLEIPEVSQYRQALNVYSKQLQIYGDPGSLHFRPFNILKTIFEDGREEINQSNVHGYTCACDDSHMVIEFAKVDGEYVVSDGDLGNAYWFFNVLVDEEMEGVIIKPDPVWTPGIVPMFKVRNNDYLQMIYGLKFQEDYEYYLRRRSVGRKMRCSENQWEIAQRLLQIPEAELGPDNEEYCRLLRARILEEEYESKLDSRL